MNSEIQQGKIKVHGYRVIAYLLGTNDVDAVVSCMFGVVGHKLKYRRPIMPKRFTDMNSITKDFLTLMNTVKALNPLFVLFCSVRVSVCPVGCYLPVICLIYFSVVTIS